MNFLGMGPLELIVILGLALVVFGPDKLPEIARQVARTVVQIRRISSEVTGDLQRSLQLDDPPRSTYGSSVNSTTPKASVSSGTATNGTQPTGPSESAPFAPPTVLPPAAASSEPSPRRRRATDDDALRPPY